MSSPLIAASTPSIVIASPSSWGLTYTTATTTFSLQKPSWVLSPPHLSDPTSSHPLTILSLGPVSPPLCNFARTLAAYELQISLGKKLPVVVQVDVNLTAETDRSLSDPSWRSSARTVVLLQRVLLRSVWWREHVVLSSGVDGGALQVQCHGGYPSSQSLALGSTFQTPQPPCPSPTSLALSPLCLIDNHTLCLATTPPLPMSTVVISCRFDGSGGSQLTTTAVPLVNSTSVMVCLAPNWGAVYAAETVSVNVLYVDRVLDGNLLYTFFDMVSSIDTATTSSMGGLSLTVRGAGFNATALYKCIFVGGADSMTTDATVTSVSVAECLVPDWGAVYKAQTVNVNLLLRSPTTTTQHHTSHHHATPQNTRHTTTPHHTT
eukprot:CAMPEP_0175822054 /NCGR_PEP_ID=MMETSP0107_2-20121207/9472_1 /TAXON_ID=195067 ORGANISM="Goniomonas pacifica, Strain CCMP1869" /NCGR_SAMPLE_ID=MMETSP0107_2 /ASSEMBLY_ACC=CAM_ASM_000203 /LENGTH=376 /DNA_ID=CAMNT_0017134491 /DNA_START=629 /DNA_END=1755 /DNA_ORIENTATION=+